MLLRFAILLSFVLSFGVLALNDFLPVFKTLYISFNLIGTLVTDTALSLVLVSDQCLYINKLDKAQLRRLAAAKAFQGWRPDIFQPNLQGLGGNFTEEIEGWKPDIKQVEHNYVRLTALMFVDWHESQGFTLGWIMPALQAWNAYSAFDCSLVPICLVCFK